MESWQPGETVVLRYYARGRPSGAFPTRTIATEGPALWLAGGTTVQSPIIGGRHIRDVPLEERFKAPRAAVDRPWGSDGLLILGRPGRAHSVWLLWENWEFKAWYVQLEQAWRPSPIGFDTEDHILDIWIDSNGTWRWKDEDELYVAIEVGAVTPAQAAAVRAEGERVIAEWPFPTGWEDWRPDASWPTPLVPIDWNA